MKARTLGEFYQEAALLVPEGISKEIGHFNIFNIADLAERTRDKPGMPYNRRAYYKIS
jgi:hypothetical protein